jgi:hypothetical protein
MRQSHLAAAFFPRATSARRSVGSTAGHAQATHGAAAFPHNGGYGVEPVRRRPADDAANQGPLTGRPGELKLNRIERELRDLLLAVLQFYGRDDVTLRIAGGWVRNKLMGLESDDIDISTDGLPGEELASMIQGYVQVCARV